MLAVAKILFPTDFSRCSRQAFNEALFLAGELEAELHMLHVTVLYEGDRSRLAPHFPEPDEILERLREVAHSEMAEMAVGSEQGRLAIVQVQRRGLSAAPVILDYAEECDADLIVLGTHGWHGATRLLLGSVASEVIRRVPCPVLTLRELDEPRRVEAVERILVPLDFSEHSRVSLAHAAELAQLYRARLDLFHVVVHHHYPDFYDSVDGFPGAVPGTDLAERSKLALEELAASLPSSVETVCHVSSGRAASEIVRAAEELGSDMVVIATHGLTGLSRLLFGSTAEEVVRETSCPVFTVKSFGKSLVAS